MNGILFSVNVVCGLVVAIILTVLQRRVRLVKCLLQPTYEEVRRDRDALYFTFTFAWFWLILSGQQIAELHATLGGWVGSAIALGLIMVYQGTRVLFYLLDRRYPPIQEPPQG